MMLDADIRTPRAEFPVVTKIVNAINAQDLMDLALGDTAARYIVRSMAEENGFKAFQTDEERELAQALRSMLCSPRAAHYGWRLYKSYRQSGDIAVDAITF